MSRLQLIRLVIETTSPMAINTGGRETGFDTQLARDANGLPYIPATSVAGVWRHLVNTQLDSGTEEQWFGNTNGSSALTISDGVVHDSKNQPVIGLQLKKIIESDPILKILVQERPHHRERVSINDRGVAKDSGKFDQLFLPTGVRFTLDIRWNDTRLSCETCEQWPAILACWQDRQFALGSTTRNGLGQIKVIASQSLVVDLEKGPQAGQELLAFRKNKKTPTEMDTNIDYSQKNKLFAELPLKAIDNWRCGAGSELLGKSTNGDHSVNIISYSEPRIVWKDNTGKLSEKAIPILCGSSIKGILAHRVAYHLRKHKGIWAEDMAECSHDEWQARPIELKELFGHADENGHASSVAGKLYVDDCEIDMTKTSTVIRHHNSIDRFTGGVRKGALYSEELLYQPSFSLKLWLTTGAKLSPAMHKALEDTFNDLKVGLLPMGAGSGRGTSLVMHDTAQKWLVNGDLIETQELVAGEASL